MYLLPSHFFQLKRLNPMSKCTYKKIFFMTIFHFQMLNSIMSRSRLSSIKDMVPERFPENIVKIETLTTKKTEKFMNARSVYADPEYLTLYKLLSFVHAALVLKGELIFYSDLIR